MDSKSRIEIPIRVLTLSIYHTCRPTGFSDQMAMVNNLSRTFVCGALVALFYTSVEAKCTLGVVVCRFSGVLLIAFWFI